MNAGFAWTDRTVRAALGLQKTEAKDDVTFAAVSTDSRASGASDLFVALRGDRFDGHDFLADAAARGASGAVVSEPVRAQGMGLHVYPVHDTLIALGALARHRRRALPARVIAVTGSAGKTTVKDLLAAALAPSFRVHATAENLNNRIGVPLTFLAAPQDAEVVVAELGTSEPGEIQLLTDICEPDGAVVTTVGEAHLTGLGSFAGVLDEKLDLVRGTRSDGVLVVGDEPAELANEARRIRPDVRVVGFTDRADSEFRARLGPPDEAGRHEIGFRGHTLRPGLPGRHGAQNVILALAMARLLGADDDAAIEGACRVQPRSMRGEVRRVGGITLLLDCYNANPQSTRAALDWLGGLPGQGGKVAVLGSMLELGERTASLHREVLEYARAAPLDLIVAVGEFATAGEAIAASSRDPRIVLAATPDRAHDVLRRRISGTETILLKGSRGVALESIADRMEAEVGAVREDADRAGEA